MLRRNPTFLALLLLSVSTCRCRADDARLDVLVDLRVELLTAALTQSGSSAELNGFFGPYSQDAQKTFFPHRLHEAVKRLDMLHARGIGVRDLVAWITSRGPLPDLASVTPAGVDLATRAGGAEELDALAKALSGLAAQTNFDAFTTRNSKTYSDLTTSLRVRLGLPEAAIQRLEVYTGVRHEHYRAIIAPLLGHTSFSWIAGPDAYLLISPAGLKDGKLLFDPAAAANLIYLGFGRAAAEEAVESLPDRRDKHLDWFPYVAEKLRKASITNWPNTLTELVTATVAVRILDQQARAPDAAALSRSMSARGIVWLPFTAPKMAEYERDRARYRTLKDFAARLYDALDEVEPYFGGGEPGDLGLADVWLTEDGVPVKAVSPGSLGARAGIRKGDTIQGIAGIKINGSESYLKAWAKWEATANGDAVPFKVKRGKAVLTLKVIMKRAGTFQGFRKKPPA